MIPVIKASDKAEKYISERCFITEIINTAEFNSFSLSKARVQPGVTTELHLLQNSAEVYYILSGTGEMECGGKAAGVVEKGDSVFIREGITQRIKNTGAEDLIFLCICSPRFEEKNYESVM